MREAAEAAEVSHFLLTRRRRRSNETDSLFLLYLQSDFNTAIAAAVRVAYLLSDSDYSRSTSALTRSTLSLSNNQGAKTTAGIALQVGKVRCPLRSGPFLVLSPSSRPLTSLLAARLSLRSRYVDSTRRSLPSPGSLRLTVASSFASLHFRTKFSSSLERFRLSRSRLLRELTTPTRSLRSRPS